MSKTLDRAEAVYAAIAHGDNDHRRWLKEALMCHFTGRPVPEEVKLDMLFPMLMEAAQKDELLLIDGGICVWHHREDNKIVIKVIIAVRNGAGSEILSKLKCIAMQQHASGFILKCPIDLESNNWYIKKGFELVGKDGKFNTWWLPLSQGG